MRVEAVLELHGPGHPSLEEKRAKRPTPTHTYDFWGNAILLLFMSAAKIVLQHEMTLSVQNVSTATERLSFAEMHVGLENDLICCLKRMLIYNSQSPQTESCVHVSQDEIELF